MSKLLKFPIGMQVFEEYRTEGYIYIDKTRFIWEMLESDKYYFLSRPRRFGKSLFLSTLEAYFEGKRELFNGLYIQPLEDAKEEPWVEYPLFYFDFSTERYKTKEDLEEIIEDELSKFEKIYGKDEEPEKKNISTRFKHLIQRAYKKTNKKVVILVDEYDSPLLGTIYNPGVNEEYREILRPFYTVMKASDKYLRFVFITGITKFSKLNIFSGMNNLLDISTDVAYSDICGITREEMKNNLKDYIMILKEYRKINTYEETINILEKRYNGYRFTESENKVYNPFSLLNALRAKDIRNYWYSSGSPSYLMKIIKNLDMTILELENGIIGIDKERMDNYPMDNNDPIPVLFQSGYLTIKDYDPELEIYTLGFPNGEVKYSFSNLLLSRYSSINSGILSTHINRFARDLKKGNVDGFMSEIKSIIAKVNYDNFTDKTIELREHNYQTIVYMIFFLAGQKVDTEVHCSTGRLDCKVETDKYIYLFEFKLNSSATSEDALNQIKSKNYAQGFLKENKQVIAIGVSFDNEIKTIEEWKMEKIES